jgi:HSP20 family protein
VFVDLQREIDEMFDELIYRPWSITGPSPWRPALDLHETAEAYLVEIDLPGVPPDQVTIRVTDNELTVAGERPDAPAGETLRSQRERPRGPFRRSLAFSLPIVAELCEAECRQGVYRLRLPKKSAVAGRAERLTPVTTGSGSPVRVVVR